MERLKKLLCSQLQRRIHSIGKDALMIKWRGKWWCEITKFEMPLSWKYRLSKPEGFLGFELWSDYGMGPRVYVPYDKIKSFLHGEPLEDGTRLGGPGLKDMIHILFS